MPEIETESVAAASEYARCGECGAAVEPNQRYCVSCGAHRAKAVDPVARYLAEASSALARVRSAEAARAAAAARRPPLPRIPALVATLLVLIAVGVGFALGSSTASTRVVHVRVAAKTTHTSTCSSKSYENNCTGMVAEP